ncbi:MAG TPA: family 1 glycosylhydrolase [Anaerolineales bacterium]|nr:family 1 glycosylhydrolase [Anaerolineales bacterium]
MPEARFNFPRGFLWGTSSSAYQVEGNNKNNQWYEWEQEAGRIADGGTCGLACDWWGGRWREDFERAVEGGQNALRFSIEWSRIQPAPDRWDEQALDTYIDMLRGLDQRGLFPLVTLHHFTDPLWVSEMGGWENDAVPELFAAYAEKVAVAIKSYVTTWATINEPNVVAALGYLTGDFPPAVKSVSRARQVMANLARGHALAYHKIKAVQPEGRVGFAHSYRGFSAHRPGHPLDRMAARFHHQAWNQFFPTLFRDGKARLLGRTVTLPEAKGTQDYLGLNFYTSDTVQFSLAAGLDGLFSKRALPADAPVSPNGMIASLPEDFFKSLEWALQFQVPIIVTENGTEDSGDDFRRDYLVEHIHQLWRAVNFNYPIKGYFVWSLVDNFEWEKGWTHRFGLWELDVETQARTKRQSAELYHEICEENALTTDMVRRYAPGLFEKMFPG